jgi:hypothetical protein
MRATQATATAAAIPRVIYSSWLRWLEIRLYAEREQTRGRHVGGHSKRMLVNSLAQMPKQPMTGKLSGF